MEMLRKKSEVHRYKWNHDVHPTKINSSDHVRRWYNNERGMIQTMSLHFYVSWGFCHGNDSQY